MNILEPKDLVLVAFSARRALEMLSAYYSSEFADSVLEQAKLTANEEGYGMIGHRSIFLAVAEVLKNQ